MFRKVNKLTENKIC